MMMAGGSELLGCVSFPKEQQRGIFAIREEMGVAWENTEEGEYNTWTYRELSRLYKVGWHSEEWRMS